MTKELEEKIDVLIKLFAYSITKEDNSQTESIIKLNNMGIRNKDIAKILNTSENYVKMIISKNKKKIKEKKKNGK